MDSLTLPHSSHPQTPTWLDQEGSCVQEGSPEGSLQPPEQVCPGGRALASISDRRFLQLSRPLGPTPRVCDLVGLG